jgi:hypothetical protein
MTTNMNGSINACIAASSAPADSTPAQYGPMRKDDRKDHRPVHLYRAPPTVAAEAHPDRHPDGHVGRHDERAQAGIVGMLEWPTTPKTNDTTPPSITIATSITAIISR